ncbi:MAG: BlaI/MecI/CopY family transcriptional regulator [Defluviitaleaceae bacterium]|nr:BlaI/MecI/CopY family transcriptional regulator [Defluviitaleaceae bacterium]
MNMRISDSELEVMRILWREGRAMPFAEIRAELETKTGWKKTTIQTLILRLRDKGVITAHNNYVTLYSTNVTQDEFVKSEGKTIINKLFGGSAKNLVAALCRDGELDENDIDDLKAFFKMERSDNP